MKNYISSIIFSLLTFTGINAQNVSISGTGTTPDASAMLDVVSTDKGLLLPRMTEAQVNSIVSPANSLMVFNTTTQCLQIYLNSSWQNIFCDGNCFVPPNSPAAILGTISLCASSTNQVYSISAIPGASSYTWTVPSGTTINSGQGTISINVSFGSVSGNITVTADNNCGSSSAQTLAITLLPTTGTQIFTYTGVDQTYTIPSTCANFVKLQCWGAAGGTWGSTTSSAGGYSEAIFDLNTSSLSPGQTITVMVGQGGGISSPATTTANGYGFGGGSKSIASSNSTGSGGGGGLSGVFTGTTPILLSSISRALVVAGGGGGTGEDDCASTNFRLFSGSGNDVVNAGGMVNMQGYDGNSGPGCFLGGGYGGGGGGYNGGASQNRSGGTGTVFAGNGGSGFVEASATSPVIIFTPEFSGISPNITDPNYDGTAASNPNATGAGNNGLVIISFY